MPDSREFAWKDMKVYIGKRWVAGIKEMSYDTDTEKELVYGAGSKARTIGSGNEKCSGEITILQSELEALQRAAGTDSKVTDLRLDSIIVMYRPAQGVPIVTDILYDIEFTKVPKSLKQNDRHMEVKLPFICLDIKYNV